MRVGVHQMRLLEEQQQLSLVDVVLVVIGLLFGVDEFRVVVPLGGFPHFTLLLLDHLQRNDRGTSVAVGGRPVIRTDFCFFLIFFFSRSAGFVCKDGCDAGMRSTALSG